MARQLFERALVEESEAAGPVAPRNAEEVGLAAAERVCAAVSTGLSRWFGAYGARALVARALTRSQAGHPALAGVTVAPMSIASAPPAHIVGLAECFRDFGAAGAGDAVVGLLSSVIDAMGRLVGDDLALQVFQSSTVAPTAQQADESPPDSGSVLTSARAAAAATPDLTSPGTPLQSVPPTVIEP